MIRFLIPKAGIAQMPSINTPTIRRLLRIYAGLSLAHPRPLRIRRLLRDIKNKSISVEWYANRYQSWVQLHKITSITITITLKYRLQLQLQLHHHNVILNYNYNYTMFISITITVPFLRK